MESALKLNSFQKLALLSIFILSIPVLQLMYVSLSFDAYVIVLRDTVSGWKVIFGYFGQVAKILVLFTFVFFLLIKVRLAGYWNSFVLQVNISRALIWLAPQLGAFFLLFRLSQLIFTEESTNVAAGYYFAWLVAAAACVLFSVLMSASTMFWLRFLKREWVPAAIASTVSIAVWFISAEAAEFWGPMSDYTFVLVALLLSTLYKDQLYGDLEEKVIGLGDFAVNIAPACSGYEGIGLIAAFTAIYLYLYKHEFRFPRAFLLFPIGALAIWLLNAVRIAVLIIMGAFWSPDVAVGGFHSQAGWITFISTSLALLWFAKKISFFTVPQLPVISERRDSVAKSNVSGTEADLAIATLVPMVVLLAVILLSSAVSAGFDWLYPVRVFVVIGALAWAHRYLQWKPYRVRLESILAGLLVAVLWIVMLAGTADTSNLEFSESLWSADLWIAYLWLFFRFAGSVVTVPIAEELAFRAYLLCKFSGVPVTIRGSVPLSVVAVIVSSLAFGALHGAWIAGTAAGLVYALVRLRSAHIGDAIVAHALTNAILFAYALTFGEWVLI